MASSSSSVFSALLKRGRKIMHAVMKKQQVGVDGHGNSYYVVSEQAGQPPRRQVEYAGNSFAAPETVPMLWHAWLRGHRATPPTAAELQAEDERLRELQRRVAVLKAADEKLRMQEVAERRMSGRTEVETDMSAAGMLRDLETEAQQSTWQQTAKPRQPH